MTNEEAIKVIKINYPPEKHTVLREALDLAVKALQDEIDEKRHDEFVASLSEISFTPKPKRVFKL